MLIKNVVILIMQISRWVFCFYLISFNLSSLFGRSQTSMFNFDAVDQEFSSYHKLQGHDISWSYHDDDIAARARASILQWADKHNKQAQRAEPQDKMPGRTADKDGFRWIIKKLSQILRRKY